MTTKLTNNCRMSWKPMRRMSFITIRRSMRTLKMIWRMESDANTLICRCCIACCLEFLNELNQYRSLYSSLFAVYKFILTLSYTQVSCERVFSILKSVKHRLRSSLGQEFLTSVILFYVERDFSFDFERAIDDVAASSSELSRCLAL